MKTPLSKPFERFNPLNDYLFFKVMGEKGDEIQLLGFLNAVLGRTGNDRLISVEILENKTLFADFMGNKISILDVRAKLQNGSRINIEVQLRNKGNFDKRSLFYWSREYVKGIKSGENYRNLPAVITINIIDFEFLKTGNYHTVFHLREDREAFLMLTDVLEIHFLNMVKWRKQVEKDIANNPLHRWLAWLDRTSPRELVEEIITMDSAIKMAEDRQVYVTGDEDAIRAYEIREMAMLDWNTAVLEEKIKIARNALAEGLTLEFIQKITGLDLETIKRFCT